jgi:PEP-CTERM motif
VLNASFGASTGAATSNGGSISGGLNAGGVAAGGPGNSTAMTAGLDTSAAGARSGSVTLNYISNGAGTSGLAPISVGSQTINVSGNVYQAAAGQLNTSALNFGTVQVGQGVSQSLSISNIATGLAGYVEDLNAAFGAATGVGASLITGSGSIGGLLAGGTNAASMVVSVNTSAAGTVNGAIPVNFFTAGAVNGVSNGLGTAAVGSANFGVSGTIQTVVQVVDQAIPVVNNPVIDLGNIRIGSASPTQFVSVTNQATGNAQAALNAGISASAPVTASGSFNLLAPGGTNASALQVGLNTSTAGARSGTATVAFVSDASNVGGCEPNCQLTLASQNVTVQGNVFRLANPVLGTSSISLAARVGDAAPSAGVVLSNSSPDIYTEGLSSAISTAAAGFSASGAIANLAAGASNTSTLRVQLDTSTAGTFGGTAELALASTGAGTTGAADLALPGQSANLSGKVYTPAVAQVATASIDFGIVHVGDAVASQSLTVTNAATQSALNDVLRGSIGGVAGPFTASGTLGDGLAAGQTDSSSLAVSLGTATAGIFSGSATASFVSHDADLVDLGLGTTSISLAGQVNNYADPRFIKDSGAGTLTSAALIYQFDFGTLSPGSGMLEGVLTLSNAAAGPADLLRGSYEFDFGSSQDFGLFGFQSFNGLAAGQGQSGLRIAFNTDGLGLGTYEDTIRLLSVGYNDGGYEGAFSPILLLVRGTVGAKPVPEPGTLLLLMYGLASLALACSRRSAAVRRDAATMAPERKARNAC